MVWAGRDATVDDVANVLIAAYGIVETPFGAHLLSLATARRMAVVAISAMERGVSEREAV